MENAQKMHKIRKYQKKIRTHTQKIHEMRGNMQVAKTRETYIKYAKEYVKIRKNTRRNVHKVRKTYENTQRKYVRIRKNLEHTKKRKTQ